MNTFELVINKAEDSDELTVDHGYFVTRAEQCEWPTERLLDAHDALPER